MTTQCAAVGQRPVGTRSSGIAGAEPGGPLGRPGREPDHPASLQPLPHATVTVRWRPRRRAPDVVEQARRRRASTWRAARCARDGDGRSPSSARHESAGRGRRRPPACRGQGRLDPRPATTSAARTIAVAARRPRVGAGRRRDSERAVLAQRCARRPAPRASPSQPARSGRAGSGRGDRSGPSAGARARPGPRRAGPVPVPDGVALGEHRSVSSTEAAGPVPAVSPAVPAGPDSCTRPAPGAGRSQHVRLPEANGTPSPTHRAGRRAERLCSRDAGGDAELRGAGRARRAAASAAAAVAATRGCRRPRTRALPAPVRAGGASGARPPPRRPIARWSTRRTGDRWAGVGPEHATQPGASRRSGSTSAGRESRRGPVGTASIVIPVAAARPAAGRSGGGGPGARGRRGWRRQAERRCGSPASSRRRPAARRPRQHVSRPGRRGGRHHLSRADTPRLQPAEAHAQRRRNGERAGVRADVVHERRDRR